MQGTEQGGLEQLVYPRTYRVSLGWRVFLILTSVLVGGGALTGAFYSAIGSPAKISSDMPLYVGMAFLFVVGAGCFWSAVSTKVVLTPESIEYAVFFSSKSLRKEEIEGKRIVRTQYFSTLFLIPRDRDRKKIKIALILKTDLAFHRWLEAIPDLDAKDWAESRTRLREDVELGATPAERHRRVQRGKKVATALSIGASAISAWGWFFPRPYDIVVPLLAAFPLASLVLLVGGKGLYQMDEKRTDARPSLALPFLLPSLVLILRSIFDFDLLQYRSALVLSVMMAAVFAALIAHSDREFRKRPWVALIALFLFSMAYSYGLISHANALLDFSAPEIYQAGVLSKRISGGRSTTLYLQIDPWGPEKESSEVTVSRSIYNAVEPGDTVCVHLHPGALKMPWYVVVACRR